MITHDNSLITILLIRGLSVIIYLFLESWAAHIAKISLLWIFKLMPNFRFHKLKNSSKKSMIASMRHERILTFSDLISKSSETKNYDELIKIELVYCASRRWIMKGGDIEVAGNRVTCKLLDKVFDAFFLFKEASASFRFYTIIIP